MAVSSDTLLQRHVAPFLDRLDRQCFADALAAAGQTAGRLATTKAGRSATAAEVCRFAELSPAEFFRAWLTFSYVSTGSRASIAQRWLTVLNRQSSGPRMSAVLALAACVDTLTLYGEDAARELRSALQRDGGQLSLLDACAMAGARVAYSATAEAA